MATVSNPGPTFVATVRPGPDADARLGGLLDCGVRVFRINYGRSSPPLNGELTERLLHIGAVRCLPVSVWVDLPGHKDRLGDFADPGHVLVSAGDSLRIDADTTVPGDASRASTSSLRLLECAVIGDAIALADGRVRGVVVARDAGMLLMRIEKGGLLFNRCGVALASRYLATSGLSATDQALLQLPAVRRARYLCPSYVDDTVAPGQVRRELGVTWTGKLFAKIESPMGITNRHKIGAACDGLVACRGDLGMYYDGDELFKASGLIAQAAAAGGRMFAVATGFFSDMARSGMLSSRDRAALAAHLDLAPAYMVINETGTSPHWAAIGAVMRDLSTPGALA